MSLSLVIIGLLSFIAMEVVSYLVHKYLLHGPLWRIHKTHHIPPKKGFELNDAVSAFFGVLAVALIVYGEIFNAAGFSAVGFGISAYGSLYFVLHDVLVHRRIGKKVALRSSYLRAMRWAHLQHHKHIRPKPGESYGLLFFHPRYFQQVNQKT